MNLGKIKASKKQMDRDDRINWGGKRSPKVQQNRDGSKIIEGRLSLPKSNGLGVELKSKIENLM